MLPVMPFCDGDTQSSILLHVYRSLPLIFNMQSWSAQDGDAPCGPAQPSSVRQGSLWASALLPPLLPRLCSLLEQEEMSVGLFIPEIHSVPFCLCQLCPMICWSSAFALDADH